MNRRVLRGNPLLPEAGTDPAGQCPLPCDNLCNWKYIRSCPVLCFLPGHIPGKMLCKQKIQLQRPKHILSFFSCCQKFCCNIDLIFQAILFMSKGNFLIRLPVAEKIALHNAGAKEGNPGSPTPLMVGPPFARM